MYSTLWVRVGNPLLRYLHHSVLNKTLIWVGVVFQRIVQLMKHSHRDKILFVWEVIRYLWLSPLCWQSDGWRFETRLARDVWRNLKESINRISKRSAVKLFHRCGAVLVYFYLLRKRDIFLLCRWNAGQPTFEFGKLFDKEMCIITLKIMKY